MSPKPHLFFTLMGSTVLSACLQRPDNSSSSGTIRGIAEREVEALAAVRVLEEDLDAVRFAADLFAPGMMVSGPHLFFGPEFPPCAEISVSGTSYPREVRVRYGDGCEDRLGRVRRGSLSLVLNDALERTGARCEIQSENLSLGNHNFVLHALVQNTGQDEEGRRTMWVRSESILGTPGEQDSLSIVRTCEEKKVWIRGFDTPDISDDRFLRSGKGFIRQGKVQYELETTKELLVDGSCSYPLQGIIRLRSDTEEVIIDFGDGACDEQAIVVQSGNRHVLDLGSIPLVMNVRVGGKTPVLVE